MGKAILRIARTAELFRLPEGTTISAVRTNFDTGEFELRVAHPSLPDVPDGCILPRVCCFCSTDGRCWFE